MRRATAPANRIHMSVPHAAGALVGTVGDLAAWTAALHGGRLEIDSRPGEGMQVLHRQDQALAQVPVVAVRPDRDRRRAPWSSA